MCLQLLCVFWSKYLFLYVHEFCFSWNRDLDWIKLKVESIVLILNMSICTKFANRLVSIMPFMCVKEYICLFRVKHYVGFLFRMIQDLQWYILFTGWLKYLMRHNNSINPRWQFTYFFSRIFHLKQSLDTLDTLWSML